MITDFSNGGSCSNCGSCCTGILPLTQGEIKRIKRYVSVKKIKEQRHNALIGYDATCPFRDEEKRECLIYEVRPEICRRFICSNDIETITRNRNALYRDRKDVFMRSEFFGNDEVQKGLQEIMRR